MTALRSIISHLYARWYILTTPPAPVWYRDPNRYNDYDAPVSERKARP